jgi:elongation factor Ts
MAVDIKTIKRLKDLTGVGLTDAKKALEEADGDFDKALDAMRKKGLTKAEKRGERETRQGIVGTYNHDNRIGVVVEVNCETDFVARNDIFGTLVKDISMQIAATNPEYVSIDRVPKDKFNLVREEFRAKTEKDKKPAELVAKIIDSQTQKYFAERCLMTQDFIKNPDQTVEQYIKENIARLGENITINRFSRIALGEIQ